MRRWTEIDWSPHVRERKVDGRRVRYLDYGEGPPLVLVHGLGGAWTTWLENLLALGEHHRVIAVDLPGFGGSEALPPPADISTHAAVLAALLADVGVTGAVVAGHSLGGLVVLRLATDRPDLVRRLVLVNAGGIPIDARRLALITSSFKVFHALLGRKAVLESVARRGRLRRLMVWPMVKDPAGMSAPFALETLPLAASPGFLGAVAAGARAVSEVRPRDVACPVLLLWGREDRVLPLAATRDLLEQLPDGRIEVLNGAGHCPMFEVPDAFNRALLAFAGSAPSPRREDGRPQPARGGAPR
jgi:pimeloyl-ACP methyl ester carboxylesterase